MQLCGSPAVLPRSISASLASPFAEGARASVCVQPAAKVRASAIGAASERWIRSGGLKVNSFHISSKAGLSGVRYTTICATALNWEMTEQLHAMADAELRKPLLVHGGEREARCWRWAMLSRVSSRRQEARSMPQMFPRSEADENISTSGQADDRASGEF